MRYLSADWIAALDDVVRTDPELRTAASEADLVIEQTVTGTEQGDTVYRLQIRDGTARVLAGGDPDAHVHLTVDQATASAIAQGHVAAQDAFMQGRLRIGGDVTALLAHQAVFASVSDLTRSLRDRTEW